MQRVMVFYNYLVIENLYTLHLFDVHTDLFLLLLKHRQSEMYFQQYIVNVSKLMYLLVYLLSKQMLN